MRYFIVIFLILLTFTTAYPMKPAGGLEPKEPTVSNDIEVLQPDEPLPPDETDMSRLKFQEPIEPPEPKERDEYYKMYEKEPEMDIYEPDLRYKIKECPDWVKDCQ